MGKKINLFFFVILCLAALLVLNQAKPEDREPAGDASTSMTAPGRIVVVQEPGIQELDPAKAADTGSLRVIANIYEGLVRFAPGTSRVEPCLARSWEVSDDGKIWTFHLRQDVRFHDGTPLDARAVEAGVKKLLDKKPGGPTTYADFVYAPVEKITVKDRYCVEFHLKYPYAPFLNNLAVPMAAPVTGPEPVRRKDGPAAAPGTGPYIPVGELDGGLLLRANMQYWDSPAPVEEVLILPVADANRRSEMLLGGRADIALDLTFDDATRLRFRGYPVYRTTGLDISYLGFYTDRQPFNRLAVRQAVAKGINREEIFKHLALQQVQPATAHLPPGVPGYDPSKAQADHDPNGAARLLREAGHGQDFSFTLITYTDPRPYSPGGGKELAEAVAWSASEAGITINIRAYPWEQFKKALQRREGDAFLFGWISDNGDPDNILHTLLSRDQTGKGQNITRYQSPELETLLVSGRITADGAIRKELYARAQDVLNRDTPWVVLGHSLQYAATSPGVSGFALSPTGWHFLGRVAKNQ